MLAEISAAITSIKTASELAKFIKDSSSSLQEAEMKMKLAELISELADTKISMAEIQEVILDKDTKIKELEDALNLKNNVVFERNLYWTTNDDNSKDGPFCPQCYDNNRKLIRVHTYSTSKMKCPTCKNLFKKKLAPPPTLSTAPSDS